MTMITNLQYPREVYAALRSSGLFGADRIDFGTHPCCREFFGAHWYEDNLRFSLYFNVHHWATQWWGREATPGEGYYQILPSWRTTSLQATMLRARETPAYVDLTVPQYTELVRTLRGRHLYWELPG